VYEMHALGNGFWEARWGRIAGSMSRMTYPMSNWDQKYHEKIRKGYKDITDIVSTSTDSSHDTFDVIGAGPQVVELINFLQAASRGVIKRNYTVSIADITLQQIQKAQQVLDVLVALSKKKKFEKDHVNASLLEMYHIIPRQMGDVRDHLLSDNDSASFMKLLSHEQDLLDIVQGQVSTQSPAVKNGSSNVLDLSALGLSIDLANSTQIDEIRAKTDYNVDKALNIYAVSHTTHDTDYNSLKISNEKLLYHGSRNENWWSILNQGLRIRPSNAVHTGSMFGDGIYGANKARKSIGYTSLHGSYWASGTSKKAYIALYRFNLGKSWDLLKNENHQSWMTRLDDATVAAKKYNSVFARGGYDLKNDEYIVYDAHRCTIKYLIEIGV